MSGSSALRFVRLSDLVASSPGEPDWVWEGYVAGGAITLLAGRPKVGKSTFAFALMDAVDRGEVFSGRRTRTVPIVLLSEERVTTLAEKARLLGAADRVECLMHHTAYDVEWRDIVMAAADRVGPDGLLIVDTLADFAGLPADSENAAGAIQSAIRPLQEVAGQGRAVLLIAHQRKAAGDHGDAVRGSNALTAAVDIVLELERAPALGANGRVIKADSRYSSTPRELVVVRGDDGYEARGELAGVLADTERERVLEMLSELGEATAEDVAQALEVTKPTIQRRLNALRSAGRVTRCGAGTKGDPFRWARCDAATDDPSGRIASEAVSSGESAFDSTQLDSAVASDREGMPSGDGSVPSRHDGPMRQALFDLAQTDRRWSLPDGPIR